jgi:glycine cleavage system H protein
MSDESERTGSCSSLITLHPSLVLQQQHHQEAVMSSIPSDLKYLESHEWVRVESDGTITVGISDHAQGALGDLVFVEVPEVGKALKKGNAAAVVESVKAASDVYSPISGEVIAANDSLGNAPELVNSDPYGQGWLFKIKPTNKDELSQLLDAKAYEKVVEDAGH